MAVIMYTQRNNIQRSVKVVPIVIIVIVVISTILLWALPAWLANLSLDVQMYHNKANVDFYEVNLLNWAVLWAPLVPAAIATVCLAKPKKFLSIVPVVTRAGKKNLLTIYTVAVFVIAYLISWGGGQFSYGFFMAQNVQVNIPGSFAALLFPFNPSLYNVNTLLTWKFITLPVMNTILTAFLLRNIFEMIGARISGGAPIEFLGRIFMVIGIIMAYFYLAAPLSVYDVVQRIWLYIVPLVMWTFIAAGSFALLFAVFSPRRDVEEIAGGTFLLAIIIVIGMVVVPCVVAAPKFFYQQQQWQSIVWDGREHEQVTATRDGAGLDGFNYNTSLSYFNNISVNDSIIDKVRQYDQGSSVVRLGNQISNLSENLQTTNIVVLNNSEYWVAMKVFNYSSPAFTSAYSYNVIYSHTNGFVAMSASTGQVITNTTSVFGVNNTYPVYFGEGNRSDIILNVTDYTQDDLPRTTPDGNLSGLLDWWKTIGMSFSYLPIAANTNSFLVNTNIFNRVGSMLLPYMKVDSDVYPVFDQADGRMYYCCPVYLDLPGFGYYETDYLRFLGWVLVDTEYGNMTFYKSPTLANESMISFAQVYLNPNIYPWLPSSDVPAWLQSQLRYPAALFQEQLGIDYTFHMGDLESDWTAWRGLTSIYTNPTNSSLYFILMDLGGGPEFVGVDLVEQQNTQALAGMYVIQCDWANFGQVNFYAVPTGKTLIGPATAQAAFTSSGLSGALNILHGESYGNILLYSYAQSLYYVIPVYSTATAGIALQSLSYVGVVDAFNQQIVTWGNDSQTAFTKLNETFTQPVIAPATLDFTSKYSPTTTSNATIKVSMLNDETNLTAPPIDVQLNMVVYSDRSSLMANGSSSGITSSAFTNDTAYPLLGDGVNYTIGTWNLAPSVGRAFPIQLNQSLQNFASELVSFRFVATVSSPIYPTYVASEPLGNITYYVLGHSSISFNNTITLGFVLPTNMTSSATSTIAFTLTNINSTLTAAPVNVNVTVTLFDVNATLVPTIVAPANSVNSSFTSNPIYPSHAGTTYTVILQSLQPEGSYNQTIQLGMSGPQVTSPVTVVYLISLTVNGSPAGNSLLRVATWFPQ